MFSKQDLDETAKLIRKGKLRLHLPATVQYSSGVVEDDFYFLRGSKQHFKSAAHFWLYFLAFERKDWAGNFTVHIKPFVMPEEGRWAKFTRWLFRVPPPPSVQREEKTIILYKNGLFKPVSGEDFQKAIAEYSSWLKAAYVPHNYGWEGEIQRAMQVSEEWNDQSFIAETESEFVIFAWGTGA